jgi:hypothetical protein
VLAAPAQSPVLLVTGTVLAGIGHGVAFLAAQDDLSRIAPGRQRAEVSAAFYVCIYLGVSVPVIGIGLVAVATTLFTAVATFASVTGGGALIFAAWHLRNRSETASGADADRRRIGQPVRSRLSSRPGPAPGQPRSLKLRSDPAATLVTAAPAARAGSGHDRGDGGTNSATRP